MKPRLAPRLEGALRREVEEIAGEVPPAEADPATEDYALDVVIEDGVQAGAAVGTALGMVHGLP